MNVHTILIHCFPNVLTSQQEGDERLRPFSVFFIVRGTGVSLSVPYTSGTALQDVCICLHEAIYWKFKLNKWIRRYTYISICTRAKTLQNDVQWKLTQWTPHYLTPIYWMQETDCMWSEGRQREQERRCSEQTKVSVDRWRIHIEESSVAYSRSISVELDSGVSIV